LVQHLRDGLDVVVDYGLWRCAQREDWKRLVIAAGARWQLIYLPVDRAELLRRLEIRNERNDANSLYVTESVLNEFFARFEPPTDDEGAIMFAGDPADLEL